MGEGYAETSVHFYQTTRRCAVHQKTAVFIVTAVTPPDLSTYLCYSVGSICCLVKLHVLINWARLITAYLIHYSRTVGKHLFVRVRVQPHPEEGPFDLPTF
jgi:hypothetical protein